MLRHACALAILASLLPSAVVRADYEPKLLQIRGVLEGPDGPLPGVTVRALSAPDPYDGLEGCRAIANDPRRLHSGSVATYCGCLRAARRWLDTPRDRVLATVTTDRSGAFEFPPIAGHGWRIFAVKDELMAVESPRETPRFVVTARPQRTFSARLVDAEGRPVDGVSVTLIPSPPGSKGTRSDADGRFGFANVSETPVVLLLQKEGFDPLVAAEARSPRSPLSAGTKQYRAPLQQILFARRSTLGGRVVIDGKPVSGAKVVAFSACGERLGTTDARGAFLLEDVVPVAQDVRASWKRSLGQAPTSAPFGPLELSLSPGAFVTGRVVDSRGRPVRGARVNWLSGIQLVETDELTDASGRYQIGPLGAGHYSIRLEKLPVAGAAPVVSLTLEPGAAAIADFTLMPTSPVEGVVVDEAGEPLSGAKVTASSSSPDNQVIAVPHSRCTTETDSKGRFFCEGLLVGPCSFSASHPTRLSASAKVDLPARDPVRLTLVLGVELSGVVVDRNSVPVPNTFVEVKADTSGERPSAAWANPHDHPGTFGPGFFRQMRTDAEGRFVLAPINPGRYLIEAELPGSEPGSRIVRRLEASAGPVEVRLVPQGGEPISGRVERHVRGGRLGTIVEGVEAGLDAFDAKTATLVAETVSWKDGRFSLRVPASSEVFLSVRSRWLFQAAPARVRAGATDVVLAVEPGVPVFGRLLRPDGSPASAFVLNGEPKQAAADGGFELTAPARGILALRIEERGCARFDYRLAIEAGSPVELPVFRLAAAGTAVAAPRSSSEMDRELEALAAFGEVPECRDYRLNPRWPAKGEPRFLRSTTEPLPPSLKGQTARVLPFLESPWEPVVRRAVNLLCSLQDESASAPIIALSERYPRRSWLETAALLMRGARASSTPKWIAAARTELQEATALDIASWSNEATGARARAISEGDGEELVAALREQAALHLPRRTQALAALAAIDSEEAFLRLVREMANRFESAVVQGSDRRSFLRGVGGAALRATAARSGIDRVQLLLRTAEKLSSTEASWLAGAAYDDRELSDEIRKRVELARSAESLEPGVRRFLQPFRGKPRYGR